MPHLTVLGATDGGEGDWYKFEILPTYFSGADITATFDIDNG